MKKLNKKQRHEIYKKALDMMDKSSYGLGYICNCIQNDLKLYPEFHCITPENWEYNNPFSMDYYNNGIHGYDCGTSNGKQFRLILIQFLIEMTKP